MTLRQNGSRASYVNRRTGVRFDGRTIASLYRRGLVRGHRLTDEGRNALTVAASDTQEPCASVECPIVDRTNEAPAYVSAVRIGDHVRLSDGTAGTVTYVERHDLPWWMDEKLTFCFTKDDGGSDAVTLPADERLTIIFARPLRRTAVAA
jgi:hypothetical protein